MKSSSYFTPPQEGHEFVAGVSKTLLLNGHPAIFSHTAHHPQHGEWFTDDNVLLFVCSGRIVLEYGEDIFAVQPQQLTLLKKDTLVKYHTDGQQQEFLLFNWDTELLKEFSTLADLPASMHDAPAAVMTGNVTGSINLFLQSVKAYFTAGHEVPGHLVKIRLMELLFELTQAHGHILGQLLQVKQTPRVNITATVENNIMNALSLHELAQLSGRSLSSFKRDFQAIYNMPPSKWIREKRLEKAKELVVSDRMSVTDICYTLGFESIAHFSRLFKKHFGSSPLAYKSLAHAAVA